MNPTPSCTVLLRSAAARRARRVLPTPPGPAKVTRRVLANAAFTSVSNRRRPTKLVDSAGSLPMPDRLAGDMPVSLGWVLAPRDGPQLLLAQSGYSSFRNTPTMSGWAFGVRSSKKLKYGATNGSGADTVYVW